MKRALGDSQDILDEVIAAGAWEGPPPESDDAVKWLRYAASTAMSMKYNCEPQISVNQLRKAADDLERLQDVLRFFLDRWGRCENYVAPHTCKSVGRIRGNEFTAEMWCDHCELVERATS